MKRIKPINLSVIFALLNLISLVLLLWFSLYPSQASNSLKEEEALKQQDILKTVTLKSEASKASYGDFNNLTEDILFHHILPHCNINIIEVNRSFFTLVTGYTSDHIFDQGFESQPTGPVCHFFNHKVIDFRASLQKEIKQISSFVWYSLLYNIKNISSDYWVYFKKPQIHTLNLIFNNIGDEGGCALAQELPKSKVHTLGLDVNKITDSMKERLREMLPHIQTKL